jgi:hypothetical protein
LIPSICPDEGIEVATYKKSIAMDVKNNSISNRLYFLYDQEWGRMLGYERAAVRTKTKRYR